MKQQTIYYKDELNDDFSEPVKVTKTIDENYKYVKKGLLYKLKKFFLFRLIATPFAFLYCKIKFKRKIVNKKLLKKQKGYFLYGNHTQQGFDAFNPPMLTFPKESYEIVNPANLCVKVIGRFVPILGGLPLPDNLKAYRNFLDSIKFYSENKAVVIYPEAHIWPYYTKIRPFLSKSFKYPVELNKPTFCFTNVYVKRKFSKKPKIITYIDGPFYGNGKTLKEKQEDLRNQVYFAMVKRSELNNYEYIKYVKEKTND